MITHIIMHELRHHILSLRLHLALILTVMLFGVGTAAYVKNQRASLEEYRKFEAKTTEDLRRKAENSLSDYATYDQYFSLSRRGNAYIDDVRERYLPDRFRFNAYNVFGFEASPGNSNPLLKPAQELSWMYIVAIIVGFMVLLFTFDAVSGEKEAKTLAATFANPVSRATLLTGKYLSAILATILLILPGLGLSFIILLATGTIPLTMSIPMEAAGFLIAVAVFTSVMAAFGLFASVLSRSANVSLLIAITFWLVFVVIVPNTALYWGQKLFPIASAQTVSEHVQQEREDINKHAPAGSWSSSSNNPFLPQHELRAANQTKLMMSEKRIRDAWYGEMLRQVERTRVLTFVSPVSLFQYMSEAVVDGGYVRFRKNWSDLHEFQGQFLAFFKDKDAADKGSPHWYNPYEALSTTKKPAIFAEVPKYTEKQAGVAERFAHAGVFLLAMGLYAAVMFSCAMFVFMRYDVR